VVSFIIVYKNTLNENQNQFSFHFLEKSGTKSFVLGPSEGEPNTKQS
jgi:hypothetical protein